MELRTMEDICEGLRLNEKQQAFVHHFVELNNATAAARKAGYSEGGLNAQTMKLKRNKEVQKALNRQRACLAQQREISVDSVTEMYIDIYEGAIAAKQYSAASNALTSVAKMHGLMVDRVHTVTEDINAAHLEAVRKLAQDRQNAEVD